MEFVAKEPVTAEFISKVEIPKAPQGYDTDFVDGLLDEVSKELWNMALIIKNYEEKPKDEPLPMIEEEPEPLIPNHKNTAPLGEPDPQPQKEPSEDMLTKLEETQTALQVLQQSYLKLEQEHADTVTQLKEAQNTPPPPPQQSPEQEASGLLAIASRVAKETEEKAKRDYDEMMAKAEQQIEKLEEDYNLRKARLEQEINRLKDKRAGLLFRIKSEIESVSSEIETYLKTDMPENITPVPFKDPITGE